MKTFLTVLALCIASASFAQIEKGRSFVSGQVGGGSSSTSFDDPNTTGAQKESNYGVSAGYGYLFADRWALVLAAGVNGEKVTYNINNSSTKAFRYSFGPYVRRYFSIAEKFYFHLDGGLSYQQMKYTSKSSVSATTDTGTKAWSIYVTPGLTYFFSNRFAVSTTLGSLYFRNSKQTTSIPSDGSTQKTFNASFGLSSIGFGASIFF